MTVVNWVRQRPWLHRWVPVVGWMALIFALSAQPDLPHPEAGWADLLFASGAHAFVFGVLAALWARALGGRTHAMVVAFGITVLYGLSDEFHQSFVPGRTPDPVDLCCDAVGALVGLGAWSRVRRQLRS